MTTQKCYRAYNSSCCTYRSTWLFSPFFFFFSIERTSRMQTRAEVHLISMPTKSRDFLN